MQQGGEEGELVGQRRRSLTVELQHISRAFERISDEAACHQAYRMQPVLEPGHHAEVAAAAAEPPEKISVLVVARPNDVASGRDNLRPDQVVPCQTLHAPDPAD